MSRPPTVIISGANGYFGAIATQYFRTQGWHVLQATRRETADLYFNLDQPQAFSQQRIATEVDLFIHAAAAHEISCRHSPYQSVYQNIAGTKAALDFCVANRIPKFIYLSTFHVFGYPQGTIDETTPPCPKDDYGLSHLQAEEYVQMYNREHNINGTVLRPSNFFGVPVNLDEFQRWSLTPLAFCREAITTQQIVLKTPGLQKRNFISILDICAVIEQISLNQLHLPLLHLCSRDTFQIRELAQLVKKVMNQHFQQEVTLIIPEGSQPTVDFNYCSRYLPEIYQPHHRLEDFLTSFCQKLFNHHSLVYS